MQAEEREEIAEAKRKGGLNMLASAPQQGLIKAQPMLRAAVALLESAGLPAVDLTAPHLEHFFYCGAREAPTGLVGLELLGDDALLRSLLVAREARHGGVGTALVEHAENYARSQSVRAIYLLTNTAEAFFARRGYLRIARAAAVPAIQATHEFKELCPDGSALMTKAL
jgi:amino-acid N-acetyltransferase